MPNTLIEQLAAISRIEWLGMATGIAGVWMSIKERVSAWFFFIGCYACYISIGLEFRLFAFLGMNIAFAGVAAYGLYQWSREQSEDSDFAIQPTPRSNWPYIGLFLAIGTFGIGWLLSQNEEAGMPYLDAFAACSGFIAQWMLGRKYLQNWLFWLLSDTVYLYIFIKNASWPSIILFGIFIILAIKGWRDWRKKLNG